MIFRTGCRRYRGDVGMNELPKRRACGPERMEVNAIRGTPPRPLRVQTRISMLGGELCPFFGFARFAGQPMTVRVGLVAGEPAGTRTQDTVIKSHVLYHLSYGLARPR